jgi:acyl-coenzyme A synthetase/AMP-(fatty) acid ligase
MIAFGRTGERRRRDLLRDVSALAARVENIGVGRWLLCCRSGYAGAVALLALARCRALAVLPPNRQPETLRRLARDATGALVDGAGDTDAPPLPSDVPLLDPLDQVAAESSSPARLDRDAPLAEFHTSGTTGDAQAVVKALRHLEDEVVTLEATLGMQLPADARIFGTAPHQHIYGLLFRVLWPLASSRPFQWETLLHAREVLTRMAASAASALVTTPAQLKRMAAGVELRRLRGSCRAVYSSGGPLDAETAKAVADQLGRAPWEIFGSTETGGVAIRRRDVHGEEWEALPGVEIHRREGDGRLEVTSPFASVGRELGDGRSRTVMGDRIERMPGGGFLLLGRADRVVKVGEKRLALPQMEQLLETHPWIGEAALLVLDRAGEGRVHAAVVPSDDGRAALASDGRRAFRSALERHLAKRYDPVVVPRHWRILDALPRDAQDKIPAAALRAAFEDGPTGGRPRTAQILHERRDIGVVERHLAVPDDLAQLEGHFDGFPVVPGVVQIGWAMQAAADLLGRDPQLAGLEALKFPQPLRPGRSPTLRLECSEDGRRLRFRLFDGDDVFATGRALLAADEPGGDAA